MDSTLAARAGESPIALPGLFKGICDPLKESGVLIICFSSLYSDALARRGDDDRNGVGFFDLVGVNGRKGDLKWYEM